MFRRGCESPPQTWSVVANFSATFMASPAFTASLLRAPFPRLDNKLLSKLDQWAQIPLSGAFRYSLLIHVGVRQCLCVRTLVGLGLTMRSRRRRFVLQSAVRLKLAMCFA